MKIDIVPKGRGVKWVGMELIMYESILNCNWVVRRILMETEVDGSGGS